MPRVLVTGGAGYIGSVLTRELVHKGYDVRVLDKFYFGKESLKGLESRIEIVQGDIRNVDDNILEGIDSVVHLAGFSNDPMADYNPKANNEINVVGTKNLARLCAEKGINRFTYASSASIYDKGTKGSQEMQDEESVVEPKAAYSISKYGGELELLEVMKEFPDFSPVILRQGTVYGASPRMRFDLVINTFTKAAFNDGSLNVFCAGSQWRPLVSVEDVSRAHIACLDADEGKVKGQIFNVTDGNYLVMDVAHRVKYALGDIMPVEVNIDYEGNKLDRSYQMDGSKLENALGFRYQDNIDSSVKDIAKRIQNDEFGDLNNPLYNNIQWVKFLVEMDKKLKGIGELVF